MHPHELGCVVVVGAGVELGMDEMDVGIGHLRAS
jgi:hypothetical protein